MAEASLAAARAEISDGMAMDAMTPMSATTMSSSISVKPGVGELALGAWER